MTTATRPTTGPSFNLWDDPWIRVLDHAGKEHELGIRKCLTDAHKFASLDDPSPLVVVGVQRLLAAILQSIYDPQTLNDLDTVLKCGHFDPDRIDAFARTYHDRFDLFHPTAPFLQSGDVPLDGGNKAYKKGNPSWGWDDPKSVGYLFSELPTATNRTLFHHATNDSYVLCPACCASGLVTLPAFASSGGSGYYPSINGVPPVYVLPIGDSVCKSLTLSLVATSFQPKTADPTRGALSLWSMPIMPIECGKSISGVSYIESLLFPARRVRLYPSEHPATCSRCGRASDTPVRTMLYQMGHVYSNLVWDDPFVAFIDKKDSKNAIKPQAGKALWREYTNLLLDPHKESYRPKIVQQISQLVDEDRLSEQHLVQFRCIGYARMESPKRLSGLTRH